MLDSDWRCDLFYRWCHDIGREQAANKPLLKIVFQVLCSYVAFSHDFLMSISPPGFLVLYVGDDAFV